MRAKLTGAKLNSASGCVTDWQQETRSLLLCYAEIFDAAKVRKAD
jgi:hypothetical protein